MKPVLGKFAAPAYALMRFMTGALFACHGAQKLFGALGGTKATAGLMLAAAIIELFGGLLIAIGLVTSIAALISSGEMAVAYFMVHAPGGFWPIVNKGELAVVYCFVFLFMSAHGSGEFSADAVLRKK
jgi:putative oxidoreductase